MKNIVTLAAILATATQVLASGITESAIQTSARSGGSLTELTVTSGQAFYFSMTSASTDLVTFTASNGLSFSFTLGQLQGRPDNRIPWVLDRAPERLADGRLRLFCRIDAANVTFIKTGAQLKISRGAANIDTDIVRKR